MPVATGGKYPVLRTSPAVKTGPRQRAAVPRRIHIKTKQNR